MLSDQNINSASSPLAVTVTASTKDKYYANEQLVRQESCPVPCGYYSQLCCAANEICYTAPNLEAQCSATALPFEKTVTADGRTITTALTEVTTVRSLSKVVTTVQSLATEITTVHSLSVSQYILTTVETTTRRVPSVTTATSVVPGSGSNLDASPSSSTSLPPTVINRSMPHWEQGIIGAGVSVGVIGLIVAALLLWWRRRKAARVRREAEEQQRMQREGPTSLPPMDTARISSTPSQRARPSNPSVPSLVPREPPPLYGPNPFDRPPTRNGTPFNADHVVAGRAPVHTEDRPVSPVSIYENNFGYRDGGAAGSRRAVRQHVVGPSGFAPVPPPTRPPRNMPRRPVGGTVPRVPHATVEEDGEAFY